MVSFPPCKINLGLNIVGKRPDGFHDLATCFYPVPWTDMLEIVPAKRFSFAASGTPVPGAAEDNLCVRAYELLKGEFTLKPVAIHLHKIIPIGAGLGGGSADGAYTLNILNELFHLNLSVARLREYAAILGSDCAFFIEGRPAIATGRGEVLADTSLSLKGKFLVIVKPEVHISTAEAFSEIVPRSPAHDLRTSLENQPIESWKDVLRNDFEEYVFKQFPVIDAIHTKLYALGASYASLSGSGSAVFGIFTDPVDLMQEFDSDLTYWSGHLD
ncbi:MAG: 4-(cytidine 5'-diphospho)-2-C-methyl-D-erythritol kinase [Bacteroidota bacterium]|nr:4-(cytidine 5'-diphospho)-2-C-methyl-D-erythritol kinase [Bacteroidota bacterium]